MSDVINGKPPKATRLHFVLQVALDGCLAERSCQLDHVIPPCSAPAQGGNSQQLTRPERVSLLQQFDSPACLHKAVQMNQCTSGHCVMTMSDIKHWCMHPVSALSNTFPIEVLLTHAALLLARCWLLHALRCLPCFG